MEYYYTPKKNVSTDTNELFIEGFEYAHLTRVLRKQAGDKITITDGERNIYHCEITKIDKEKIHCSISGKEFNLYEPEINVSLYIAPLRNADRYEFAIEKAVELGVSSIHPVITEFTVSKNLPGKSKVERLKKIMIGAMGQSQRCLLPALSNTITFNQMLEETHATEDKIVMYEFSDDTAEIKPIKKAQSLSVFIGPEGGISNNEITELKKNNWKIRSLGKRKLRAETAAIVSVFEFISKQN